MWRPTLDFEDEMMEIQPEHDLIFGDYSKNPDSLAGPFLEICNIPKIFQEEQEIPRISDAKNKVLHLVSKIRQPFIGRRLEEEDLEDSVEREAETIAMIRNTGSAPSVDVPLTSKKTLPTITSTKSYKISNGCPVLLDSEFFKLKPRNPDSDTSGNNTFDISCSSTDSVAFLKHFKTLNASQEGEDSSKMESDSENNNVKDSSEICSPMPDIIAKMKRIRKTKMRSRADRNNELGQNSQSEDQPPVAHESQSSHIVSSKTFLTPKDVYMKKRAVKS